MRQFKKKTIALVLASVVTVVGAYGAEYFRNSLMGLKFESSPNGAVNMTLFTKRDGLNNFTTVKKDANTYVIMLPETNSQMPAQPDLGSSVASVDVKTMPYTNSSKGYTKVTVKTYPNTVLQAKSSLFIPSAQPSPPTPTANNLEPIREPMPPRDYRAETYAPDRTRLNTQPTTPRDGVVDIKDSMKQFEPSSQTPAQTTQNASANTQVQPVQPRDEEDEQVAPSDDSMDEPITGNEGGSSNLVLFLLALSLVIVIIVFVLVRAKNQMLAVLGEQTDFDVDDEDDAKKKKKKEEEEKKKKAKARANSIRNTVKKLDKTYSASIKPINTSEYTPAESQVTDKKVAPAEESTVVDLDELFQEAKKANTGVENQVAENNDSQADEEENSALEDFLNAYTLDEDGEAPQEEQGFDEELYNKYINDGNLKFSDGDVDKINKLLSSEIKDDTLNNLEEFAPQVESKDEKPSKQEILQNFVTTYSIDQNITFTKEDIDALQKLISVELDNDFITDLRTDSEFVKNKEAEIVKGSEKPHKTSELLTLNVKDMLPDLSEALKNQGGRKIESEVKPEVVYYSEGYDVSVLSLKDKLPDLSLELNNKDAYKSRPSDSIELAESGYDVAKMSVAGEIPDLDDVRKHPEKYETKEPEPVVVDADALLKNISNVTFKPFYDGNEEFEIINDFDEEKAPSVSDVQEEFSKIGDLEIVNDDENIEQAPTEEYDDFEALYDNNFVDLDKTQKFDEVQEEKQNDKELDAELDKLLEEDVVLPKLEKKISTKPVQKRNAEADLLLEYIQGKQQEREAKAAQQEIKETQKIEEPVEQEIAPQEEEPKIEDKTSCIIDDVVYTIVNHAPFDDTKGCYLAKNSDGYSVLGYVEDRVFKIKHYDNLKSEKLQARVSEKLKDGGIRYLVRLGVHKFVLNVVDDKMEFVMDLC